MLKKWKIIATILAASFILTEASKSVHFLFFHHEAEHHSSCSSSDCLSEEEPICIFEHVQFFPFESDTGTIKLANKEKVIILPELLPEKIEQQRIKSYLLRGPPVPINIPILSGLIPVRAMHNGAFQQRAFNCMGLPVSHLETGEQIHFA